MVQTMKPESCEACIILTCFWFLLSRIDIEGAGEVGFCRQVAGEPRRVWQQRNRACSILQICATSAVCSRRKLSCLLLNKTLQTDSSLWSTCGRTKAQLRRTLKVKQLPG